MPLPFARRALVVASLLLAAFSLTLPSDGPLLGFDATGADAQLALEAQFAEELRADNLQEWMAFITSRPHHVGSPFSREKAEYMADKFRSWGYSVEIEEFEVLFPTPTERVLELVAPTQFTASLTESQLTDDHPPEVWNEMLPPYNAYSADGDVTAELVYVNQGIPRDYEELERLGIDVEGKIVIARYGGSWRGIKPKVAAEHGAIGCILFSDPRDDGYRRGDVYPEGSFRPETGVQRGSVSDMPTYPGDPTTPGVGSKPGVERYDRDEAPTIMPIPVLPIAYADAQPLLEALGGPAAPAAWQGALPLTYHIGPGPARVHLKLSFNWDLETAYNVVAKMEGSTYPDQWVMRGNHHDAWGFGAADPTSGMVAMMEEARAIASLTEQGWRPKRTLVYAGWDAEEPGLLGSTEWAEYHADELQDKLALYLNTDGNGRGFLRIGGSHTLEPFINQVARTVPDPQTEVTVDERARAQLQVQGQHEEAERADLRIYPLGSGSDYTPFIQHLGVASLNIGFGGENAGGAYHSAYDTYDHYTRFGDPGFQYGVALAEVTGRAVLRFANADVMPYTFSGLADNVALYAREITQLIDQMRNETAQHNRMVDAEAYALAADPTEGLAPPAKKEPVPYLNFAPLQNAIAAVEASAQRYDHALRSGSFDLPAERLEALNEHLLHMERALTSDEGLPRRPWFRHQIYAPGYYTGYGVKTLPGVREAIEQRSWTEAAEQIGRVAETLQGFAAEIDAATQLLATS